jgi:predicted amidophosphoribosyltransferase
MASLPPDNAGAKPAPAGIGNCRVCPFLESGSSTICYRCARKTIEGLAPFRERCKICDLPLRDDGTCGNPLCNWSARERHFDWNYAIAMRSGVLEKAISDFKYHNRSGWRNIFGRVLVGFLDDEKATFENFDFIVASPTFLDPKGTRKYDHTREVILAAEGEADGRWPFDVGDPPTIVKTAKTEPFVGKRWGERKKIAETELRSAIAISDTSLTKGKRILVYDDVFTDGFTLREVGRALIRDGGARGVCGVTLTRQPFRQK